LYDPVTGQFVSPDPYSSANLALFAELIIFGDDKNLLEYIQEPKNLNRYAYVQNNPIILIDPLGLASLYTDMTKGTTTFDPQPEDPEGIPFTITTRNEVYPSSREGANDPFTTDDVAVLPYTGDPRAYGPSGAYIDTGDSRGRDIHGGGSSLQNPLAPKQGWQPTFGCTRGQNEDVIEMGNRIQDFQSQHPNAAIPYSRYRSNPLEDALIENQSIFPKTND